MAATATPVFSKKDLRLFKAKAEALFRKGNPDAVASGVVITWTFGPNEVEWADGTTGITGMMQVVSPGYRTRKMHASYLRDSGLSVR